MIDLSKFDPSAPWFEYLYYKKTCEDKGKEDSVQDWQEQRGDIKKPEVKKTPGVTEGWDAPIKAPKVPKKKTAKKVSTDIVDNPKTKKSVEIIYEGKEYPSISAAAKANKVSAQTISRRLGRYKK